MKNQIRAAIIMMSAAFALGCERSADSFSIMSDDQGFKQSASFTPRKIDILWVIDNSGSMETSQTNLTNNFQSFISRFSQLNYDFQMGVISTASYFGYHYNDNNRSRLRDGANGNFSGIRIITPQTPNLGQVFVTNATQGTNGSGDERAFSSFEHALSNPLNAGFVRPGAFLQVIIVSDEDDFSHYDWQNGVNSYNFIDCASNCGSNYVNNATWFPISRFTNFLDGVTGSTASQRNYSVSAIAILDDACRIDLNNSFQGRKVGKRYMALANATGGTLGSLCGDFGDILRNISDKTLELSAVFQLSREPHPESIVVTVDGNVIPQDSTNGWSYDAATLTVRFHGTAIPGSGADVRISFDPKNVRI